MCDLCTCTLRRSKPHVLAVGLPKSAHRRLGDAIVVGRSACTAHFDHRVQDHLRSAARRCTKPGAAPFPWRCNPRGRSSWLVVDGAPSFPRRHRQNRSTSTPTRFSPCLAARSVALRGCCAFAAARIPGDRKDLQPDPVAELVNRLKQLGLLEDVNPPAPHACRPAHIPCRQYQWSIE